MAKVFAWMRPTDLIWNYWVNNYLLAGGPASLRHPLYWNNDNTRLPAALHGDLIDFFKHNPLSRDGSLEVCGTPVVLTKVNVDSFQRGRHQRPHHAWDAVYRR